MGCMNREYDLRAALRVGLLIAAWVLAADVAAVTTYGFIADHSIGLDAHAYWLTSRAHGDLYGRAPDTVDAYLYSPAFAQAVWPLALLPWTLFAGVWMAAEATAFAWLVRPLGWRWGIPAFLMCVPEIVQGNIVGFIAVVAVLGARRAYLWALPALTKPTLGALGLAGLAARGEWRSAARGVATIAAITGVSVALWPSAWVDWLGFLRSTHTGTDVYARTLIGFALVVVGGRRGWWWVMPVALFCATPVLAAAQPIAYLAALVRLHERRVSGDAGAGEGGAVVGGLVHHAGEPRVVAR
jgi:hypothetical protein